MVSEAAASGRPVVVLAPSLRSARHRRFLQHLAREEYIHLVSVDEVAPTLERLWRTRQPAHRLDDTERLTTALARLI